jgi:hypothetical protein
MTPGEELRQAIREAVGTGDALIYAVVKSVEDQQTCTVTIGDTDFDEVLINSVKGNGGFISLPTVGSKVLVMKVESTDQLVIVKKSDIDKVIISNETQDFRKIMDEFIDELISSVITTPAGAGAIAPKTIAKLKLIKEKIGGLFDVAK